MTSTKLIRFAAAASSVALLSGCGTLLSGNGSEAANSGGLSVQQITDMVKDFYAKYDPTKPAEDAENISKWAFQNGLPALNKKLRDKYGADLDTVKGPPI